MVLSGTKKTSAVASMSNQTTHYGIMGGLTTLVGGPAYIRNYKLRNAPTQLVIPVKPVPGLAYMRRNRLLSVNPQCSGHVGRLSTLMHSCRSSNQY